MFRVIDSDYFKVDGRDGQTRTDNPSLPKRVRYQLRHIPTFIYEISSVMVKE